jgi:hypothetical protein
MQRCTRDAGDVFDIGFVQMPAQNDIDAGLQFGFDVRAFGIVQPIERVVEQRDLQRGIQAIHVFDGIVETAAADPQPGVVVIALTEQGAVHRQNTDFASPDIDRFHRSAGRVFREGADAGEIVIVPADEFALLQKDVGFGGSRVEIGVGLIPRPQGPCETDTQITVNVVIAGNDEQMSLFDAGGVEQGVEEGGCGPVFDFLAAMGDIAGREDQIRLPAAGAKSDPPGTTDRGCYRAQRGAMQPRCLFTVAFRACGPIRL